jgi:hypothetical protein
MPLDLVQSECDFGDIASIPYDEFASIMVVVFSVVIILVTLRLNGCNFHNVMRIVAILTEANKVVNKPRSVNPQENEARSRRTLTREQTTLGFKPRRRSLVDQGLELIGFKHYHILTQSEFLLPENAARRSLAGFQAKASKHSAPGVSKRPYRFDYTTADSSFLRHTFCGSVLNNELLWLQPILHGCVSGLLVREVSCQHQS